MIIYNQHILHHYNNLGNKCEMRKNKLVILNDENKEEMSILKMNLCYSKIELIKSIKQSIKI